MIYFLTYILLNSYFCCYSLWDLSIMLSRVTGQNIIKLTPTLLVCSYQWSEWSYGFICEDWDGSLELLMSAQFQCWVLTPWPCCKGSAITNTLSAKISSSTCGYLSNSHLGSVTSINFMLYVSCGRISLQEQYYWSPRLWSLVIPFKWWK